MGEEVSLGGSDADTGDSGGLFTGVTQVDGPEDEHFASDDGVGVMIAVVTDEDLFVGRKFGAIPSGHP